MAWSDIFLRKTAAEAQANAEHAGSGLKRTLSAFDLTMMGIGAIIGAGLFSSIKDMICGAEAANGVVFAGAGPAVVLSFILTGIACGFAALCYAEIAAMVPISGSAYSYSYVAFGELVAWIIGWDLIIEYAIGNVYVADAWKDHFIAFLESAFPKEYNIHVPVWLTMDFQSANDAVIKGKQALADFPQFHMPDGILHWLRGQEFPFPANGICAFAVNLPAAVITILLTLLLIRGVKESTRLNAVMVLLKLILVAVFIGVGFTHCNTANWTPFMPNKFEGVWHGAALGFFAYIGFDAVSTAGEEAKNPQRDLPRGMIWSLVICTVLYIATGAALTGMVSTERLKDSGNDPLAFALKAIGFENVSAMLAFGAAIAMTAVLLVFQLGQTRIFYVMARDGLLPKVFAKLHPKYRTPHVNTWVTGIFVAVLCSLITPTQAIGLTNIGTLFAFILVSIGVIVLRTREPTRHRPFKVPGYPVTPILSAAACLALVFGLESSNWGRFIIWLVIGLIVYALYGYRHSVLRRERAAK